MKARSGSGWQTAMADLSMILFMLTASAVARQESPAQPLASVAEPSLGGEPLAVWIDEEGLPRLRDWLAQQPQDVRQQVTVTARYAPGNMKEALHRAELLALEAGEARIVVEPGAPGVRVTLGFDIPAARLAHSLRNHQDETHSKDRP